MNTATKGFLVFGVLSLGFFGSGCGGGTVTRGAANVTGTLTQPNGDPVPGALVYVEQSGSSSLTLHKSPKRLTDNEGETCEDVPTGVTAVASDCTAGNGSFSFAISDCTDVSFSSGKVTISYRLGALTGSFSVEISCSGDSDTATDNAVPSTESTVADAVSNLKIAVCSGAYDQMQNVLARMGFAPSDNDGDGDNDNDGYDGSQTENFNFFRGEDSTDSDYPNCCNLLKGQTVAITDKDGNAVNDSSGSALNRSLDDYDIVFVNCGSGCESGGFTSVIDDILTLTTLTSSLTLKSAAEISSLQSYVDGGGALYVTDLSYDFVEQAFPGQIDFLLDGKGTTAETLDAAQKGTSGSGVFEPLASDVVQSSLSDYLESVSAGNTDCGTPSGTGALNSDGTVNICDFLSSWGVMGGLETTNSATIWIKGAAQFSGGPDTNAAGETVTSGSTKIPLTVSFTDGSGAVLYSSYHTDNSSTLTADFLPQERVLQFLVLELFGAL